MIDLTTPTVDDGAISMLALLRLPLDNEKRCQAEIARALAASNFRFEREVPVAGGIIDFLLPDSGIGIEVKIKGQAKAIYRQLQGYAFDQRITRLVLASSKAMALPPLIGGKRCTIIDLARGWL